MWQEQRRFALRHLRDLGFGRTSSENLIQEEIHDLIQKIRTRAECSDGVVDFKGLFNLSLLNVLWSIVGGERFKHDDDRLKKLLNGVNLFIRSGNPFRAGIPVPKFMLNNFPFLKKLISIPVELFFPIQDLIRVTIVKFRIFISNIAWLNIFLNVFRRLSINTKKTDQRTLLATLSTSTWTKWTKWIKMNSRLLFAVRNYCYLKNYFTYIIIIFFLSRKSAHCRCYGSFCRRSRNDKQRNRYEISKMCVFFFILKVSLIFHIIY